MKEVLQVAYLRHLQDFYLFESVKDGSIAGEECPEYWNNFIKIQGENLWKIHRFPPAESLIISRYNNHNQLLKEQEPLALAVR